MPGTVLSVSYVVKTPTFGPDVHTQGVFGVQLRIAKGKWSFFPNQKVLLCLRTEVDIKSLVILKRTVFHV